jgi:hypothetical protein
MDQELREYLEGFRAEMNQRFEEVGTSIRGEMNQRFEEMGTSIRGEMREMGTSIRGEMSKMGTSIRGEMSEMGTSIRGEMREMGASIRGEMSEMGTSIRGEMNQRFEKVHEDNRHTHIVVEGLRHELGLVTEGVSGVLEQMNAAHKEIYKKMDDLKSANVAAYRDLDVRVRALETRKPRSRAHPQKQ